MERVWVEIRGCIREPKRKGVVRLTVTRSIPRERYLNFRVSSIYCGTSEMLISVLRGRSKKRKIEHGDCPTHKGLGDVEAMQRRERDREIEGVKLPEAITLGSRCRMPVWSSSSSPSSPTRNPLDGEPEQLKEGMCMGTQEEGGIMQVL
jgi:hypothetical protein